MKVGDYVRTEDGYIAKYLGEKTNYCMDGEYYDYYEFDSAMMEFGERFIPTDINKNHFVKSSPNIIDLIEVGDYVNGYKILDIEKSDIVDKDGNFIKEKIKLIIGRDMYGFPEYIEEKDIKSIVTKEQFEQISYKVRD